ncbi:MAG: ABC transporter ATP-binding protein, partial [Candidatus Methylomirabilales bacterium]
TGRENLAYTARLNGLPEPAAGKRIQELLEQVGIAEAADRRVDTYSRGMRQRLGIADALVKEPRVLILDEPTIGIDPEGVREILDLIEALPREGSVTVLLSSHLLYQVQAICGRVGIFVKGRMVAEGPVAELAARHASEQVVIEVGAGDWNAAGEALGQIGGITRIEREDQFWAVVAGRDLRTEIASVFASRGVPLLHLRRRGEALDDIYARYFEEEPGGRGG